jgi:hypothetical protein
MGISALIQVEADLAIHELIEAFSELIEVLRGIRAGECRKGRVS